MHSPVELSRIGAVAVIRVDHPPVNALSHAVRSGLLEAFRNAERNPQVNLVMLYCAGRTFIAGADIREFGQPPILTDLVQAIENASKPSLAVMHGSALGGGLELALACHYRILRRGGQLGLPEVKLGLMPGAGGTQRLPRLAGIDLAMEMILGGEPLDDVTAQQRGIVDALFDSDLLDAGLAYAEWLLKQRATPRRTGRRCVPDADGAAQRIAARREELLSRQPDAFSPPRCLEAIEAALQLPLEQGLRRERELFLECLESPQRAELVARFFAERAKAKAQRLAENTGQAPGN